MEDVGKDGAFTRRMLEMGLTPGTRVRMGRRAPMGDPIEVWLRGYALTLRGRDIRGVRVRPVDP